LLLVGIVVLTYAQRLAGKIKTLADAAHRIGAGDLELEVKPNSRDEIGDLTEAIGRMQEIIRLSIERLRRG
jgi:HAMP domain-containing protein